MWRVLSDPPSAICGTRRDMPTGRGNRSRHAPRVGFHIAIPEVAVGTRFHDVVGGVARGLLVPGPRRDQHHVGPVDQLLCVLGPIGLCQRHRPTVLAKASGNIDDSRLGGHKIASQPGLCSTVCGARLRGAHIRFHRMGESEGVVIRTGARPEFKPDAPAPEYATTVREIRQIVNPLEEMDDVRAAFAYLVTDPSVDPDRIAVWGTSLGGGLSLAAAIEFPQIKVMMTQVGAVNPRAGFESTPADSPLAPDNMTRWRGAIARGTAPSFPSEATPGLQGFPDMPDFVRYDPYRNLDQLRAASLIIEAADEELMDIKKNGVDLYQRIKDKVPARYEVVQGTHYDVYRGDGYQKALGLQKAWLAQHLPVK